MCHIMALSVIFYGPIHHSKASQALAPLQEEPDTVGAWTLVINFSIKTTLRQSVGPIN